MTSTPDSFEAAENAADSPADTRADNGVTHAPSDATGDATGNTADTAETPVVDPALLKAHDVALKALTEIADLTTVGAQAGHLVHDERTVTLMFESLLPGYPGWKWAATLAKVDVDEPITVLEIEQVPGDSSLLAPEWVPWTVRLAAFREAQAKQATEEAEAAEQAAQELEDVDGIDADDDVMENDFSDYDDEFDGVDIDLFDEDDTDDDDTDDADDDSAYGYSGDSEDE